MLSVNKIEKLISLCKLLIKFHLDRKIINIPISSDFRLSNHGWDNSNPLDCSKFSTVVYAAEDQWFMLSVHDYAKGHDTDTISSINFNNNKEINGSIQSSSINAEEVILDNRNWTRHSLLSTFDNLDSQLFQLQTIHDDHIILAMFIQYYMYNHLNDNYYISYNTTKIIDLDDDEFDNMCDNIKDVYKRYDDYIKGAN
jgi:hypothetical protein